ncbi:MFS transporter [Mycobacterium sp. ACS1612]|uniref:MFS transporter n=1 Tax=Mycobacterium sp. ACS1612 TaxID=1834117 RepID=UPI000A66FF04|nr:MFS transporter [Mycobacterium sp. ACS1612]
MSAQRRASTLVAGCAGVALVVGSMVAFNTALGDIARVTSASQTQLTWIVDGYTVALACLLLPAGAIGDRYGRRSALLAGLIVFAVASVAPALSDTPEAIVLWRIVAGAGAAFVMPATLALMAQGYPQSQRARIVGLWAGVAGCAGVAGMLGSAVLLQFSDWRAICWALGGAAVLVAAAACAVPAAVAADAPRIDWVGAVLIAAAIAVVVLTLLDAPRRGWDHPLTLAGLAAAAGLGWLFVVVERRRPAPLLDVTVFADARFAASVATVVVMFAATFGFFYLAMQYAQLILGYSALTAAFAFAPFALPVVVLSALSFRFAPRLGLRTVLGAGLGLIAVGFASMTLLQQDSPYALLASTVLVIGSGIGLCTASATSAIMSSVRDERQGLGSAINDVAREVGAAIGIAIAGSVLAERYTDTVTSRMQPLPEMLRAPITESPGQALQMAGAMGARGDWIRAAAVDAFVTATHAAALVLALIAGGAAAWVAWRAPGLRTKGICSVEQDHQNAWPAGRVGGLSGGHPHRRGAGLPVRETDKARPDPALRPAGGGGNHRRQ